LGNVGYMKWGCSSPLLKIVSWGRATQLRVIRVKCHSNTTCKSLREELLYLRWDVLTIYTCRKCSTVHYFTCRKCSIVQKEFQEGIDWLISYMFFFNKWLVSYIYPKKKIQKKKYYLKLCAFKLLNLMHVF